MHHGVSLIRWQIEKVPTSFLFIVILFNLYNILGGQGGYNIPEMISVPDLPTWITEEGSKELHDGATNDKMLPELAKRLLCDAYLCMYQNTDVMMYQ